MIFGDTPLADAEGAILAHSLAVGRERFKKGRVLSAADVAALPIRDSVRPKILVENARRLLGL